MGITHLSTLKSAAGDARLTNSYMLLTWMDPETLVNNDYPVAALHTPDFSNIPRIYAQLLLKLYRFADPAFVAKGISACPFEDQTRQMLALREGVRSMLNDHRLFTEVHAALAGRDTTTEMRQDRQTIAEAEAGGDSAAPPQQQQFLTAQDALLSHQQQPVVSSSTTAAATASPPCCASMTEEVLAQLVSRSHEVGDQKKN